MTASCGLCEFKLTVSDATEARRVGNEHLRAQHPSVAGVPLVRRRSRNGRALLVWEVPQGQWLFAVTLSR